MNVLSLFDGKSSGYTACELAGITVDNYYSSEIDKFAIKVSEAIHPGQTRLGDVQGWENWDLNWASIDIVLGGFPCQAWSVAGKQLGDRDERGMLFWTMLDVIKRVRQHNPNAQFLLENVKMKKEFEEYISHHTEQACGEVFKTLINSSLVSAQNRNRYYWTSFPVQQPADRGVTLRDVIDFDDVKPNTEGWHTWFEKNRDFQLSKSHSKICSDDLDGKSICMTARQFASWNGNSVRVGDDKYRFLSPRECFRLQTVPEDYIDTILAAGVSNTQLYKIAGNGWTDEVIAHILRSTKKGITFL